MRGLKRDRDRGMLFNLRTRTTSNSNRNGLSVALFREQEDISMKSVLVKDVETRTWTAASTRLYG